MINKSQAGKKGTVGAPLKKIHFPRSLAWTFEDCVKINKRFKNQVSDLTIRKAIARELKSGTVSRVGIRPVGEGKVGRPKQLFVLTALKKETVPVTASMSNLPAVTNESTSTTSA